MGRYKAQHVPEELEASAAMGHARAEPWPSIGAQSCGAGGARESVDRVGQRLQHSRGLLLLCCCCQLNIFNAEACDAG